MKRGFDADASAKRYNQMVGTIQRTGDYVVERITKLLTEELVRREQELDERERALKRARKQLEKERKEFEQRVADETPTQPCSLEF